MALQDLCVVVNLHGAMNPHGGDTMQDRALEVKIDKVISLLNKIIAMEAKMAGELDTLVADVTANGDVVKSAVATLEGLTAKLDAAIASGDPKRLTDLSTEIKSQSQRLADAIVANTPAEA